MVSTVTDAVLLLIMSKRKKPPLFRGTSKTLTQR
jgi:hypothetical protein